MPSSKASDLERLTKLDAERLHDTVALRRDILRAARHLLPAAIRDAKRGKPALLRIVVRLAMRPTFPDRPRR